MFFKRALRTLKGINKNKERAKTLPGPMQTWAETDTLPGK